MGCADHQLADRYDHPDQYLLAHVVRIEKYRPVKRTNWAIQRIDSRRSSKGFFGWQPASTTWQMKEILIRNLDSSNKEDIRRILEEYLQREYVGTSALSTAVEKLIREFNANETGTKKTIETQAIRIRELEAKVNELTIQNQHYYSRHAAFVLAFHELFKIGPTPH